MRIQFCGADRTVTGSCHALEINGLRLLLDVGLYQGPRDEADRLNHYLPPDAAKADAVILSHGHLDHCGKLPVLTRAGYKGPIYCTPATAAVARIVLNDSAQIQEEDVDYLNRRTVQPGQRPIEPLYRKADVGAVFSAFHNVNYAQKTDLGRGVSFTLLDAGHILGSAYVLLEWNEGGPAGGPGAKPGDGHGGGQARRLLFTADVGRYGTPILRDPAPLPGAVDLVITESTYGNKSHGPIADVEPQLLDAVKFCVERRGRLLVPSFAVGRTQTILWYVQKFIAEGKVPAVPIFVDSPMGVEASHVTQQFRDYYDDETRDLIGQKDIFGLARVTFASSPQDSRKINDQAGPCVIIASSPTCEFGRILHHLGRSVEAPNDLVVFVGYIPPNTLGRRLQEGQRRVRIFDRWYDVKCQVRTIHGLSAHADGDELLRFLKPTLGANTAAYVVHGEADQAEAFGQRLVAAGVGRAAVPAMESSAFVFGSEGTPAQGAGSAREED